MRVCTCILSYPILGRICRPGTHNSGQTRLQCGLRDAALAGHLYSRGDYEQATELARQLVLDTQARRTMAAAARSETETLGWMAAIRRVRDMQYGRAVATFRAHKRYTLASVLCYEGCAVCLQSTEAGIPCGPLRVMHLLQADDEPARLGWTLQS